MAELGAVILAGGAARRLSHVDKPGLVVGGRTLLSRALDAVTDADPVVIVGPRRPLSRPVRWTREDPPGSGPLAALAAGIAALPTDCELAAVLAADLVGVRHTTVERLCAALGEADGAVLTDDGVRQWLIGVWRVSAVRAALPADPADGSLRHTLGRLSIVDVAAEPGEARDIDTPADLP